LVSRLYSDANRREERNQLAEKQRKDREVKDCSFKP
jgi:hypothetical protein